VRLNLKKSSGRHESEAQASGRSATVIPRAALNAGAARATTEKQPEFVNEGETVVRLTEIFCKE
jgi:hypothetical protein